MASSGDLSRRRVTEEANALTSLLDAASPLSLVRLLGACDAQLFSGFLGLPGLYDAPCVLAAARAARAVARALRHPRPRLNRKPRRRRSQQRLP